MHWANQAALVMWESESLDELIQRDFKSETSDAVQKTLNEYQQLFESGEKISRLWRYSPKGVLKEAYCQLSGYKLEDGRMAMLVEALPADIVDKNQNISSIISLSTYNAEHFFISGNPPFMESCEVGFSRLEQLFSHSKDYTRLLSELNSCDHFEDDILVRTRTGELWHRVIASKSSHDRENSKYSILIQQVDINDRKLGELSLEKDVVTDPLTGLLNRRGLNQTIDKVIDEKQRFVVFYIDLDGFKLINDSLGHAVGDTVLQTVANRLTDEGFNQGIACRFGGDEFIWVINEEHIDETQEELANRLIKQLNKPYFDPHGQAMLISASVGIAHYPEDGNDFSKLVLRADAAMYLAKKQGKRRWVNYIRGMENTLQRHSQLAQHLFQAQKRNELCLHYQPIYNVATGCLHSFEALLRWSNPLFGMVPAEEAIRVAEEVGVIVEIENWVIKTAIKDLIKLRKKFGQHLCMAVNVSSKHFTDPNLGSFIVEQLKHQQLEHSALVVELTESALLSDVDLECNSAQRIVDTGISLSIDDFGTGYSSLAYLHKIPASIVKIDRSFTQRIEEDQTMISSIHHLIESLNFETLVEGVETKRQSKMLQELGIFLQQGYGLGMPEPLEYYLPEEHH